MISAAPAGARRRYVVAPGSGDAEWSNVVLMMGFAGADASTAFVDESDYAHTMTANGNVQVDTAASKFDGSSALFDGSGDYISTPDSDDFEFGSGDFTIEFFVNHANTGSAGYVEKYNGSGDRSFAFIRESSATRFLAWIGGSAAIDVMTSVHNPTTGVWYHYCAERDGTKVRVYRDGVMVASQTSVSGTLDTSTASLMIGRGINGAYYLNGALDELRITKGVARYASDAGFTVPSEAYPRSEGGEEEPVFTGSFDGVAEDTALDAVPGWTRSGGYWGQGQVRSEAIGADTHSTMAAYWVTGATSDRRAEALITNDEYDIGYVAPLVLDQHNFVCTARVYGGLRAVKVLSDAETYLGAVTVDVAAGDTFGGLVFDGDYYILHEGVAIGGPYPIC